jgi:hypothetical protein
MMKRRDFLKAISGMRDEDLNALRLLLEQNIKLDSSALLDDEASIQLAAVVREQARRATQRGENQQEGEG